MSSIVEDDESPPSPPPSHPAIDLTQGLVIQVQAIANECLYRGSEWFDERTGAFPYVEVQNYCHNQIFQKYRTLVEKGCRPLDSQKNGDDLAEELAAGEETPKAESAPLLIKSQQILTFISENIALLNSEIKRFAQKRHPSDVQFLKSVDRLLFNADYLYQTVCNHYSWLDGKELVAITLEQVKKIDADLRTNDIALRKLIRPLKDDLERTEKAILDCQDEMLLAHQITELVKNPNVTKIALPYLDARNTIHLSETTSSAWTDEVLTVRDLYYDHMQILEIHRTYFLKSLLAAQKAKKAYEIARKAVADRIKALIQSK